MDDLRAEGAEDAEEGDGVGEGADGPGLRGVEDADVRALKQGDVAAVLAGEGDFVAGAGLLDGKIDGDVDDAIAAVGDGVAEVEDAHAGEKEFRARGGSGGAA